MVDLSDAASREAIELLYRGYRAFTRRPDEILEKRGLGRAHHRILYFVGRTPDGSVADLITSLSISKQALNVPLRQLESMGLISSRRAKQDRRIRRLQLTASGRRLEQRLSGTQTDLLERVFEEAGADAEDAWRLVMKVLADAGDDT